MLLDSLKQHLILQSHRELLLVMLLLHTLLHIKQWQRQPILHISP